jgi:hypothetical protein
MVALSVMGRVVHFIGGQMKSAMCRMAAITANLFAAPAACVGCSPKQPPSPEPTKPAQIRWHGPATGYEGKIVTSNRPPGAPPT